MIWGRQRKSIDTAQGKSTLISKMTKFETCIFQNSKENFTDVSMETVNSFARDTMQRVQHRFGGIRDKRNTEGGIRDENISRDPDALISVGGMRDSIKIVGGILD